MQSLPVSANAADEMNSRKSVGSDRKCFPTSSWSGHLGSEFSRHVLLRHAVMVSYARVPLCELITGSTGWKVREIEICFQASLSLLPNRVPVKESMTHLFRVHSFITQTNEQTNSFEMGFSAIRKSDYLSLSSTILFDDNYMKAITALNVMTEICTSQISDILIQVTTVIGTLYRALTVFQAQCEVLSKNL